jgi:hypothetical protein
MGSFWRETRNSLLKDRNFRIATIHSELVVSRLMGPLT